MKEMLKDNWLNDEKARESKISIWEMYDNRKAIYDEHRENCDRRNVAEKHEVRHTMQRLADLNRAQSSTKPQEQKAAEAAASIVSTIIVIIVMIVMWLMV